MVKDRAGRVLKEIEEYLGRFTNNVAEYRALIRALEEAGSLGAEAVEIRSDSDLLVSQLNGKYKVKSPDLSPLYLDANRLLQSFAHWSVTYVPRSQNAAADALANRAIARAAPDSSLEFSALVEERKGRFVARVPALPGVEAEGTTRTEALEAVQAAITKRLRAMRAQGQAIPREERLRVRLDGMGTEQPDP